MALFAALVSALAVFVAIASLLTGKRPDAAAARMSRWERGEPMNRDALLGVPFSERVGGPLVQRVRRWFSRLLPASMFSNLERRRLLAGEPLSLHALTTMQLVCAGLGVLLAVTALSS